MTEDAQFLSAFARNSPLEGYRFFQRPLTDNNKFAKIVTGGYLWGSFYLHYQTNPRYRESDIFIKADDDIVFLDLRHFSEFVHGVTKKHVHFPNILNNDAGEYDECLDDQSISRSISQTVSPNTVSSPLMHLRLLHSSQAQCSPNVFEMAG